MERLDRTPHTESEPKLLFKIILMRHEKTEYTDLGQDLTDAGIKDATKAGEKMQSESFLSREDKIMSFHSPAARTKGTSDHVLNAAGIPTENSRSVRMLGPTKIFDMEAFEKHTEEYLGDDPARIAEDFHTGDFHKNHPEIVEPHLKKKERLYRAMEYLIRSLEKNAVQQEVPAAQVFAVSHFEIITHLIDDVFGIENTGYRSPLFGEQIKISAFQTKDPEKIQLKILFRELEKEVTFNRKNRSIE